MLSTKLSYGNWLVKHSEFIWSRSTTSIFTAKAKCKVKALSDLFKILSPKLVTCFLAEFSCLLSIHILTGEEEKISSIKWNESRPRSGHFIWDDFSSKSRGIPSLQGMRSWKVSKLDLSKIIVAKSVGKNWSVKYQVAAVLRGTRYSIF